MQCISKAVIKLIVKITIKARYTKQQPNTIDMTDLRTPLERARAERDKKLCRKYAECTQTFVGAKPYRIMRILAEEFGMTPQGIRAALVRNGMMGKKKEVPL